MLVGLVGYAGSGKDAAAGGLIDCGWTRVSFADPIREMALAINPRIPNVVSSQSATLRNLVDMVGWTKAKQNPEVRRLLQAIGTDAVRRIIGENTWIELARQKIEAWRDNIVITDVRHENEAAMIREQGGILIRITRPNVGPINEHSSETTIRDIRCDGEIVNDGSENKLRKLLIEMVGAHLQVTE